MHFTHTWTTDSLETVWEITVIVSDIAMWVIVSDGASMLDDAS